MENEGRIKLIIAGLVLAAFAIAYFILAQKYQPSKNQTVSPPPIQTMDSTTPVASPGPLAQESPTPSGNISGGLGGVETLPNTGFPAPLIVSFATSAMIAGYFLRKFPD